MMNLGETVNFFGEHFGRTAFRMEIRDYFDVDSDGREYERYLAGEEPTYAFKESFLKVLREERAAGKLRHRVRVVTPPLNDYLRYEFEWGYLPNVQAGEDVRILDLSEISPPNELITEEFWILDDTYVLRMNYDHGGTFVGSEIATDKGPYQAARDTALAAAEPFTNWWRRHPEEHRDHWMATTR